ncbi:MAG: glycosyltransferase [Candidatus Brocadiia bacterium]
MHRGLVVQIITRLISGGAQVVCLRSALGLRDLGWDVEVWAGPPVGAEGDLLYEAWRGKLTVRIIPEMRREIDPRLDLRAYMDLKELILRVKPDVVHTHSSKAGVLGRFAAAAAGTTAVFHTVHGFPFGYGGIFRESVFPLIERAAASRCIRIFCVSRSLRERALKYRIADEGKLVHLPWGIASDEFKHCNGGIVRALLGLGDRTTVVLPARLAPDKGHFDALEAMATVRKAVPDAALLLVGDGPLREDILEHARALGIADAVFLSGKVSRASMPDYLAAGHVLLLPSYREGLPLVIAEGYLSGIPAVAYACDGVPELVQSGQTGYCVPVGDRVELASRLSELLGDAELRARFACQGRSLVEEQYNENRMLGALESHYLAALK